jgi:adenosylcobinamide-GDP ribazoletransferase
MPNPPPRWDDAARWWDEFRLAAGFLTRLPLGPHAALADVSLAQTSWAFPLVGVVVGLFGGLGYALAVWLAIPPLPAALIALGVTIVITGGLHEDGLADTADGLGGGDRQEKLAIMRDSRIGSYGAIAISLSLLARFVFLTELAPEKFAGYFIAGQVLSRWTAIPLCFWLPSARPGPGQGALVARKISWVALLSGTLLAGAITAAVLKYGSFCAVFSAVLVAAITGLYYRKRIGGITGDCFGATIQLAEIGVYLTGVIVRS